MGNYEYESIFGNSKTGGNESNIENGFKKNKLINYVQVGIKEVNNLAKGKHKEEAINKLNKLIEYIQNGQNYLTKQEGSEIINQITQISLDSMKGGKKNSKVFFRSNISILHYIINIIVSGIIIFILLFLIVMLINSLYDIPVLSDFLSNLYEKSFGPLR